MTTEPTRRYVRQATAAQHQSHQQNVDDAISGSRRQLDMEDYIYNPPFQRADWRRTRSGSRRSVGGRMTSGISTSAADTASVCSVSDVISSTVLPVPVGARNIRYNSSLNIGRNDVIEPRIASYRTTDGTSGASVKTTSGFDCETVVRCLDSCDKILLRHSTTIT